MRTKVNYLLSAFLYLLFSTSVKNVYSQTKTTFVTVSKNNSECIIDLKNQELIPSGKYRSIWTAYDPDNKLFVVTGFNGKEGLYLLGEREVIPCEFDDVGHFYSHGGFVKKDNKWALLNRDFKPVTGYIFDGEAYFYRGKASVKKDGRYFIIDSTGKELKELPYDYMIAFGSHDKYKMAKIKNSYGYIDREGNAVIPVEYEDVEESVESNLFPVKRNGKWGYVNEKNQVVIPFKYDRTRPVDNGIGLLQNSDFRIVGAVNERGEIIYEDRKYQNIAYSNAGKYSVLKDGLWGYIDSVTYREIISPRFSSCERFYNGIAVVKFNGFSNIIDTAGNLLLPQQYQYISNWGHILIVEKDNKFGVIDKTNRVLLPIEYDGISYGGHFAYIQKNKLWGVVKADLNILIQPKYDYIRSIDETNFLAKKGIQSFIVDKNGIEKLVE